MPDPIVAYVEFVGGIMRPVYEELGTFFDDNGERVYGVWFIPREECDRPSLLTTGRSEEPLKVEPAMWIIEVARC